MSKDFVNQYAKALFEVADNLQTKSKYLDQIRIIGEALFQDVEILNFFKSVEVSLEEKQKTLSKALDSELVSADVIKTVKLILDRNKISYLPQIVLAYQSLNDHANGVVRGTVRSSHELEPDQQQALVSKIETVLNKKVILDYIKDSKVIGGLKAQVGSYTFDDTFETHLKKMKDQINRRTH